MTDHKRITTLLAVFAAAVGVAGCNFSSSGSSSGSSSSGGSASVSTGSVSVLMTDDPTEDYEAIIVNVTGISLRPEETSEDAVELFSDSDGKEVDLLQLRDYAELFTVEEDVAVGEYDTLRLEASGVDLVDTDGSEWEASLSDGTIDLVLQDPLVVTEDRSLFVELDIDAEESLVTEDDTGELVFQPVVFVTAYDEDETGENGSEDDTPLVDDDTGDAPLISVQGQVRPIDDDDDVLACPSAQAADVACVRLALNESTPVYFEDGESMDHGLLQEGDGLVAMGLLRRDDDGRRELQPLSVMLGERPQIGTRGGAAAGPVSEDGELPLRNGDIVGLHEDGLVVDNRGQVVAPDTVEDGQGLTTFGLVQRDPRVATLVILRGDDAADEDTEDGAARQRIRGELVDVHEDHNAIDVQVGGDIVAVELDEGGMLVVSGRGRMAADGLDALDPDNNIRITAHGIQGDDYFDAERIIAVTRGGPPPHAGGPNGSGPPDHAGPPDGAGPPGQSDPDDTDDDSDDADDADDEEDSSDDSED